jgi:hypothetical protein
MMSGPDPYSSDDSGGYYSPDQGIWYPDYYPDSGPSIYDLISQGISQGAQTAQIIGSGYPPGSNVTYAPQYGAQPQQPLPLPQLMPGAQPQPKPPAGAGIQLSTTTLMLLVGGFLLFTLGGKRGK